MSSACFRGPFVKRSVGPICFDFLDSGDGWHSFMEDQLALLDHLGVENCLLLGGLKPGHWSWLGKLGMLEHR